MALSGGLDSVALLHWLVASGFRPVVAHYNHRWSAEETRTARFCRQLAQSHGLTFVSGVAPLHERRSEGAAREARYAFLVAAAKRRKVAAIVTAHTMEDQAETVLMQVLRGAGLHGLSGMRAVSERDGVVLLRPWLGVRRAEIAAYAERHGLAWREDAFNRDPAHLRVRVRREVLPQVQAVFRESVVPALARLADLAGEDDAFLDEVAVEVLGRVRDRSHPERLVLPELRALPLALRRRVVRRWLREAGVPGLGAEEVARVLGLLDRERPARVNLPADHQVRRAGGRLSLVAGAD